LAKENGARRCQGYRYPVLTLEVLHEIAVETILIITPQESKASNNTTMVKANPRVEDYDSNFSVVGRK
jgi:hypothetical protein